MSLGAVGMPSPATGELKGSLLHSSLLYLSPGDHIAPDGSKPPRVPLLEQQQGHAGGRKGKGEEKDFFSESQARSC